MHHIFGNNLKTPTFKKTTARPSTSSGSYNSESKLNSNPSSVLRRKPSFTLNLQSPGSQRSPSGGHTGNYTFSPERRVQLSSSHSNTSPLPEVSQSPGQASLASPEGKALPAYPAESPGSLRSTHSYTNTNMLARPSTGYQSISQNAGTGQLSFAPMQPPSPTLETITYQHIQETSSKRISTLDYLRKAHEGRVYWFNTLLFNKSDLQKMPYFDSKKLARRATNYLLLGLSLPTVVDLNSSNALEFLRTLNALLAEFESFQQIHPSEGATSSLSRARIPQMFKRATTTSNKGRRTSSAAEIGLPMGNDSMDHKSSSGGGSAGGSGAATSFLVSETDLLPGEEYTHLLTPSLPFDPDFYETFATLCDVLIDCYTRLMSLVPTPRECSPLVAEMFTKADSRVRKIIVQGVVKEFEDSSRAGLKSEVAGVGRVVLGGLM